MVKLSPHAEQLLKIVAEGPVSLSALRLLLDTDTDGVVLALEELNDAGMINTPQVQTKH